jgi:thiamine biosynthesis lipoprotein
VNDVAAAAEAGGWKHLQAWDGPSMGGRLVINITIRNADDVDCNGRVSAVAATATARKRAALVARRLNGWAARLTRFDPRSDLSRLNDDRSATVVVRPTLAAVLHWAASANERSGGIVDVTLLDERLAAERGDPPGSALAPEPRPWSVTRGPRRCTVRKPLGGRFDLDGVAKGWLADRALAQLVDMPGAIVDADGDIAVQLAPADVVDIGVEDPGAPGNLLTWLRLGPYPGRSTFGVATSGVSRHRWGSGRTRHHLIDPRTRRPAITDLVQATVLAPSAREAEILAKTAVILGRNEGASYLARAGALAAVLLTDTGECIATLDSIRWLGAA